MDAKRHVEVAVLQRRRDYVSSVVRGGWGMDRGWSKPLTMQQKPFN